MHWLMSESSFLALIFLAVFVITYLFVSRSREPIGDRRLPPALPSLPVVGSLPFLLGHRHVADYFLKTSKRLGDVFSLYAGSRYIVVINGCKAIREALSAKGTNFASRPDMFKEFAHDNAKKGIFFRAYDETLKENRKLSLSILKEFGFGKRLMEARIQEELTELLANIRETSGKPFEPCEIVMSSVGNLLLNVLYGRRFDRNDPKFTELLSDIQKTLHYTTPELDIFPLLRYFPYYRRVARLSRVYSGRFFKFGDIQLTECCQVDSKTECFASSFVNIQGPNFDRTELLFILRDLTFAGLDTTTSTLLWSLVHLANHRSVQDRLHAEIDTIVGRDRRPTLDDRKRLPYLEATIFEIMRYRTLVPLSVPHSTLCDTEVNGYFVPAQTMVMVNLYSAHKDPDVWQDPDQFRPERFLDETWNLSTLKDCVIAFSIGKRSCLGEQLAQQEVLLFLAGILQQFDICPPEGQDRIDDSEKFAVVIQPMSFEVRLILRNF